MKENVRNGHIHIQPMKQHMTQNEHITRYLIKTVLPQKKKKAWSLEGPKGPRVAETCESEGPKGPRTS